MDQKKMTDSLQHRGPDGEGFYINQNIGLGHRRLSIIDLDTGDQPIYNEDKTIAIVFNGEIYNYIELRNELKTMGHQFRTSSDTEVIVHAYEQWGVKCLQKFNGCWAFALWDENINQLFIARDRLGEKPLFFTQWDNTLIFGSELKSLFAFGVPSKIRTELIQLYLSLSYIPAPLTFFQNIQKLEAGHYLIVSGSNILKNKYWDLPAIDESSMLSDKNKIYDEFQNLFSDSIKLRMRADVPFGAFLSGGLDSSSIVAIMSETSNHPVETFTVGFDDKEFNERDLARQVAEKFKTSHHEATFNSSVFSKALKEVVNHFDEPFGDFSTIPTSFVCEYARKYVKMVLTGDGGDEALSGYPTYELINFGQYYTSIPNIIRKIVPAGVNNISKFSRGKPRYFLNRTYKVLSAFELDFENGYFKKLRGFPSLTNQIFSFR
ncbi:MAG: asparagine synthase (glutamine-hydrolyzing) [Saprospiraceae bacterium]|nr:asparagine synthase (glutamine-hydrolyzing) [Saprospiraceae bacterium]